MKALSYRLTLLAIAAMLLAACGEQAVPAQIEPTPTSPQAAAAPTATEQMAVPTATLEPATAEPTQAAAVEPAAEPTATKVQPAAQEKPILIFFSAPG